MRITLFFLWSSEVTAEMFEGVQVDCRVLYGFPPGHKDFVLIISYVQITEKLITPCERRQLDKEKMLNRATLADSHYCAVHVEIKKRRRRYTNGILNCNYNIM